MRLRNGRATPFPPRRCRAGARCRGKDAGVRTFFRIFSTFFQKGLAIEQMFCYTKSTEKQEKSVP
jgi:hypothetical protein